VVSEPCSDAFCPPAPPGLRTPRAQPRATDAAPTTASPGPWDALAAPRDRGTLSATDAYMPGSSALGTSATARVLLRCCSGAGKPRGHPARELRLSLQVRCKIPRRSGTEGPSGAAAGWLMLLRSPCCSGHCCRPLEGAYAKTAVQAGRRPRLGTRRGAACGSGTSLLALLGCLCPSVACGGG